MRVVGIAGTAPVDLAVVVGDVATARRLGRLVGLGAVVSPFAGFGSQTRCRIGVVAGLWMGLDKGAMQGRVTREGD